MPETALSSGGLVEGVDLYYIRPRHRGYDHLGDSHPACNDKFITPDITQYHAHLSAIVRVDSAR